MKSYTFTQPQGNHMVIKVTAQLLIIGKVLSLSPSETNPSSAPTFATKRTFNGCTTSSCNYCMASKDNTYTYCLKCGNGRNKTSNDGTTLKTECGDKLKIDNCLIGSTISEECLTCRRYHYLTSDKKCEPLYGAIKDCVQGYVGEDGSEVRCSACKEGYAVAEGTYCTNRLPLYDFCDFGGVVGAGGRMISCVKCDDRYRLMNGACAQEISRGCLKHMHNNSKQCIQCNYGQGYYAVDAEYFYGYHLQKCEFCGLRLFAGWVLILVMIGFAIENE